MLGLTLEKHKENQCFQLRPLKMLRKIKVLRLWEPLGDPKGVRAGPGTPRDPQATFLAPIGSPYGNFSHPDRDSTQNFGADLARGVPPLNLNFFLTIFGIIVGKGRFLGGQKTPLRGNAAP